MPPPEPRRPRADGLEAQLVRTVPEKVYDGLPNGEFTILESYVRALRAAERLIYLESQFLWSPELIEILEDKLRDPPHQDFRVVVVLPAKPNNGNDDTRGQLGVLVDAAREGGDEPRFLACTLFQPHGKRVYVHAKIGIVDDAWMTVGSANLNEHSLFNDTEVNVVVRDPRFIRAARLRLWEEHLEQPTPMATRAASSTRSGARSPTSPPSTASSACSAAVSPPDARRCGGRSTACSWTAELQPF